METIRGPNAGIPEGQHGACVLNIADCGVTHFAALAVRAQVGAATHVGWVRGEAHGQINSDFTVIYADIIYGPLNPKPDDAWSR